MKVLWLLPDLHDALLPDLPDNEPLADIMEDFLPGGPHAEPPPPMARESLAHSGQKSINILNPPFLLIFARRTSGWCRQ